jgi:hypothetical protein
MNTRKPTPVQKLVALRIALDPKHRIAVVKLQADRLQTVWLPEPIVKYICDCAVLARMSGPEATALAPAIQPSDWDRRQTLTAIGCSFTQASDGAVIRLDFQNSPASMAWSLNTPQLAQLARSLHTLLQSAPPTAAS